MGVEKRKSGVWGGRKDIAQLVSKRLWTTETPAKCSTPQSFPLLALYRLVGAIALSWSGDLNFILLDDTMRRIEDTVRTTPSQEAKRPAT